MTTDPRHGGLPGLDTLAPGLWGGAVGAASEPGLTLMTHHLTFPSAKPRSWGNSGPQTIKHGAWGVADTAGRLRTPRAMRLTQTHVCTFVLALACCPCRCACEHSQL